VYPVPRPEQQHQRLIKTIRLAVTTRVGEEA
jgi:hypothetical protein